MGSARTLLGIALLALGCGRTPPFELEDGDGSGGLVEVDACADPAACTSIVTLQRAADILFVIDNSGSMAEEQGTLAANFPRFIDVLEGEMVGASYRVGVTTTDGMGLRATSCRSRLSEFEEQFTLGPPPGQRFVVDERAVGCLDSCAFDWIDLQPSDNGDGQLRVRPWLEKGNGSSNLPPGVSMAQALQCVGPQGINGFGYEMPLESMHIALTDDATGFMRDEALLAVIFVTDEADCSASRSNLEVLGGVDNIYWSYPGEKPTSAACWRAGNSCAGGPGVYDACWAEDKDWNGNPTSDPNEAVLYPIQRYIDLLTEIGDRKAARGGNSTVLVASIAGVPIGYENGAELVFADSWSWEFNMEYGMGPGCGQGTETLGNPPGIPPTRLIDFSAAFATEGRNVFSICSDDYAIALVQIAETIERLGARACVPGCATDVNEHVVGLQPGCRVIEERAEDQGGDRPVEPCVLDNAGWRFASEEQTLCYRQLTDPDGSTPWTHDDMSPQCVTRGSNLEFVVERREGVPVPPGVGVRVDCPLDGPVGTGCEDL